MVLRSPVDEKDWKTWALNWTFTIIGALILFIVCGIAYMVKDLRQDVKTVMASDNAQNICIAEIKRDIDNHMKGNKQ